MRKRFLFYSALCSLGLLLGCQKDDLCPESTATTPRLLIDFQDFEDPDRLRAVQDLVVIAQGLEDTLLGPNNTNGISIPLKTDENVTEYRFIRNAGTPEENTDTVRFSYTAATEYLNRACGYRVNYSDLQVILLDDGDSWIRSYNLILDTIEDESESHISLYH